MIKRLGWVLLATVLLSGCGPSAALYKDKPAATTAGTAMETTQAAEITVQCAIEAAEWLTDACVAFEQETGIRVLVQGSGSDAAIQSAAVGTVGLAVSYRDLTEEELQTLQATKIAYEAVAVVVHPDNPVTTMNPDEVNAVFSTMILDWQEVGGKPGAIRPVVLSTETSIRKWFDKCFNILVESDGASISMIPDDLVEIVSTVEELQAIVAVDPLAVGFLPVVETDSGLKSIDINGMQANAVGIDSGEYMPAHPVYVVVNQTPDVATEQLAAYLSSQAFAKKLAKIGLLKAN